MNLELELAFDASHPFPDLPSHEQVEQWVKSALLTQTMNEHAHHQAELAFRVINEAEMTQLNGQFRNHPKPTNVLSFPSDLPEDIESPLLGDIAICAPVVVKQAAEQHKTLTAHWAHMVVHGTLHLLGYDHQTDEDADVMETLETRIMSDLGFPDPYQLADSTAVSGQVGPESHPLEPPSRK